MRTQVAVWADPSSPVFTDWLKRVLRGYRHSWCSSRASLMALVSGQPSHHIVLVHLLAIAEPDIGWLRELSAANPHLTLVVLGTRAQQCPLSFRMGAGGFILVGDSPEDTRGRLQSAIRGEMSLCPRAVEALQTQFANYQMDADEVARTLSVREKEALRWLCQGEPLTRVAQRMGVSYHTATTFVRRMYDKVGVSSRVALTRFGFQAGFGRQRRPSSEDGGHSRGRRP